MIHLNFLPQSHFTDISILVKFREKVDWKVVCYLVGFFSSILTLWYVLAFESTGFLVHENITK